MDLKLMQLREESMEGTMKLASPISSTKKSSLFINRDFALLWSGQAISIFGDIVFDTTLVLWIADRLARNEPWAPLAVSGVLLATSLPSFVLGPIAGVFVDRWDKRSTMLWTDALRAFLVFLLMIGSGLVPLPFVPNGQLSQWWQLGLIYIIVVLSTVCSQLFNPSRFVLIGDLVAEPDRARASGLSQVTANLSLIIGPPLAATLFFGLGVQWALAVNALSFVVSFLTLLALRVPRATISTSPGPRGQVFREFGEGVRFFATHRVLRTILLVMFLVLLGGGVSETLGFFFVTQNLHASPPLYGFLSTASGVGLLVGAVLASWGVQRIGVARAFWLGVLLMGAMEIVYARLTNFPLALVILFLQGMPNAALNVAMGPLVLSVTPRALVGRAWALLTPAMNLAALLSTVTAGYLSSTLLRGFHATILGITFGSIDTLFTISGVLALVGGVSAMLNLRGVGREAIGEPGIPAQKH
jgi:MFS family permease